MEKQEDPTEPGDIDDIDDQLDVLESVLEEINLSSKSRSELQILMSQYIHLEDNALTGIEHYMAHSETVGEQHQVLEAIHRFNKLSHDFQVTWKGEYWEAYELVREGLGSSMHVKNIHNKPSKQLAKEIEEVQDLALSLSKYNRKGNGVTRSNASQASRSFCSKPHALALIDQESLQFQDSRKPMETTLGEPEETKKCSGCRVM